MRERPPQTEQDGDIMAETRSKHTWWRTAAVHFFRVYFRYLNEGLKPDTPSRQKAHFLCETVINTFSQEQRDFLQGYYTAKWGEDKEYVQQYSRQSGIGEVKLWRLVEDANRMLFESAGLLEPKQQDQPKD